MVLSDSTSRAINPLLGVLLDRPERIDRYRLLFLLRCRRVQKRRLERLARYEAPGICGVRVDIADGINVEQPEPATLAKRHGALSESGDREEQPPHRFTLGGFQHCQDRRRGHRGAIKLDPGHQTGATQFDDPVCGLCDLLWYRAQKGQPALSNVICLSEADGWYAISIH